MFLRRTWECCKNLWRSFTLLWVSDCFYQVHPQSRLGCFSFLSWRRKEGGSRYRVSLGNSWMTWVPQRRAMLKSPVTIQSPIVLIKRSFFFGSSEEVSSHSRSVEIRLRLLVILQILTNVIILQVALFVHHGNKSEMRVTLHNTHTHCTLVRLWGSSLVYLCAQTEERRVDL